MSEQTTRLEREIEALQEQLRLTRALEHAQLELKALGERFDQLQKNTVTALTSVYEKGLRKALNEYAEQLKDTSISVEAWVEKTDAGRAWEKIKGRIEGGQYRLTANLGSLIDVEA